MTFAATLLRMELDGVPLWRGEHVEVKQLVEDFARYLYLPRMKTPAVVVAAIHDGLGLLTWEQDSFAYAESYDEEAGRYRGLRTMQDVASLSAETPALLVRPEAARRQLDTERPAASVASPTAAGSGASDSHPDSTSPGQPTPTSARVRKRYHATVPLDPARVGRDASRVADEVISHLAGLVGAKLRVTLEVEAELPDGVSEQVVRTVTENARTLKFTAHGFEEG